MNEQTKNILVGLGYFAIAVVLIFGLIITLRMYYDDSHAGLYLFFRPSCGHCVKLKPEWNKVVARAADENIRIAEVNLDVKEDADFATKMGIDMVPTIMVLSKGNVWYTYNGPRKCENILAFARTNL